MLQHLVKLSLAQEINIFKLSSNNDEKHKKKKLPHKLEM